MNKKLNDYPHLERLAAEGYAFHLSDYISAGFDLFKKDIGGFVGYTIIYMAIMFATNFVPGSSIIVSPALSVGWAIVCYNIIKNQHQGFGEFFKGFDHFVQLLLVSVITLLLMTAALIPLGIVGFTSFGLGELFSGGAFDIEDVAIPTLIIGILAFMIPLIYIGVAWAWAPYFVVFYKMQFWEAMEASRKIVTKNWWMVFGFLFVVGLIAGIGVIGFGVGVLFTIPAAMCMQYIAFAEVTGLNKAGAEGASSLEDHLVE
ncbi:MAG: hypothetical protein AAF849_22370 [Bacteroidota bacterium]